MLKYCLITVFCLAILLGHISRAGMMENSGQSEVHLKFGANIFATIIRLKLLQGMSGLQFDHCFPVPKLCK